MIFLSAGHHKKDPGAVSHNVKESELTVELRDLIMIELNKIGANYIVDNDTETLAQYIARIKPGSGSVLCELHFNASSNELAKGCEVIISNTRSTALAAEICNVITKTCGIYNRGVKDEAQSHRGRLGILHTKAGLSVLPEICFITNTKDMQLYNTGKIKLAAAIASILVKYDALTT